MYEKYWVSENANNFSSIRAGDGVVEPDPNSQPLCHCHSASNFDGRITAASLSMHYVMNINKNSNQIDLSMKEMYWFVQRITM